MGNTQKLPKLIFLGFMVGQAWSCSPGKLSGKVAQKQAPKPTATAAPTATPEASPTPSAAAHPLPVLRLRAESGTVTATWRASSACTYALCHSPSSTVSRSSTCIENATSPYRHTGLSNGTRVRYALEETCAQGVRFEPDSSSIVVDDSPNLVSLSPHLYGVAYGAGLFVTGGTAGALYASGDGSAFSNLGGEGTRAEIADVAFGNGKFVAVGDRGLVAHSSDGLQWKEEDSTARSDLVRIEFLGDRFAAFDNEGHPWISRDGEQWSPWAGLPTFATTTVAQGNGRLVFGGGAGLTLAIDDAKREQRGEVGSPYPIGTLAFGLGAFLSSGPVLGQIFSSQDGVNWTPGAHKGFRRLHFDGTRFVGVNETVAVSDDGISWSEKVPRNGSIVLNATTSEAGGRHVAVGQKGRLCTSPDGIAWQEARLGLTDDLNDILQEDGRYFVAGKPGYLAWSSDLTHWTASTRIAQGAPNEDLRVLAAGGDRMVVAGNSKFFWAERSTGFTVWEPANTEPAAPILTLAYGNGRFVAAGKEGKVYVAEHPSDWSEISISSSVILKRVIFWNGQFVLLDEEGRVLVSPDGHVWTQKRAGGSDKFCTLAGHETDLYLLSCGETVLRTRDLQTWESMGPLSASWPIFKTVVHDGEKFILSGSAGLIATTKDFLTFKQRGNALSLNVSSTIWDADKERVILVGEQGYLAVHGKYDGN